MMETKEKTKGDSAKEIVMSFIEALNKEDFAAAKKNVSPSFKFEGVMGSRDGADAYFKDMEHMKFKYDIKKVFSDEKDVCLFYDIKMSGQSIFSCGWYQLENNKIQNFKVLFDPRPLLEHSNH